jgi:hypothetical protein
VNAFHICGGLLAIWAVLLSAMGIVRHDFPGTRAAARAVMGFSVLLVALTIGAGIFTASVEDAEQEEEQIQAEESQ